ncbi:bifunctional dihydroneopterin aldolase/7,8-dihydroneopterin epimerase [Arsenophonus endosymbiont of Bemisia tabaci]|uniref:bifunctional dihydroneopterin aldolase/7,8-dihydroneopterin epimerase n=1 Tax=Arsenophonus endosymbiont of Bemisia tabaci TaxID=536059 RepID=UPI0015F53F03|nr:bifunctional dihydroneopterin aldolase/7,8-dihydroneopterin epimerase [Arsenophonus endosymbiont of Bemisia tabaci]CAA2931027.1 Dihydroneopterin aldolase [Arsenophonus endosymbiont of Bemisia tabaci Q2]
MDIIFIEQLSVFTTIGAYDWEHTIQQKLLIDIEMGWDNQQPAKSDQVENCLDYAQVSQVVIKHIETQKFALIERVAQEIADIILNQFNSCWVCVKVCKPGAVAQAKQVGVIIERTKSV